MKVPLLVRGRFFVTLEVPELLSRIPKQNGKPKSLIRLMISFKLSQFRYPLSININVGHQQSNDIANIKILSLISKSCHQDKVTSIHFSVTSCHQLLCSLASFFVKFHIIIYETRRIYSLITLRMQKIIIWIVESSSWIPAAC